MKSIYIQPFITDAQKSWVTSELAILPHHLQSTYINGLKTLETFQHQPLDFQNDVTVLPRTAQSINFILHFCIRCISNNQIDKFSTKGRLHWYLDFRNHEAFIFLVIVHVFIKVSRVFMLWKPITTVPKVGSIKKGEGPIQHRFGKI